jgi:hypothetical protein
MFNNADAFNGNVTSWDTSGATASTAFYQMFIGAVAFNQDISGWDFSGLSSGTNGVGYMLASTAMSTANYDALLQTWDSGTPLTNMTNVIMTGLTYTSAGAGGTARTSLINDHGWSISGDSGV